MRERERERETERKMILILKFLEEIFLVNLEKMELLKRY